MNRISATPQPGILARGVSGAAMARKPLAHGQNGKFLVRCGDRCGYGASIAPKTHGNGRLMADTVSVEPQFFPSFGGEQQRAGARIQRGFE